jgi:hypothetical protein
MSKSRVSHDFLSERITFRRTTMEEIFVSNGRPRSGRSGPETHQSTTSSGRKIEIKGKEREASCQRGGPLWSFVSAFPLFSLSVSARLRLSGRSRSSGPAASSEGGRRGGGAVGMDQSQVGSAYFAYRIFK